MNDFKLPPELENLERELAVRSCPLPAAELRQRVTAGVHNHLRRERRLDYWHFAAAAALIAGFWLNLSMSAARETNFHFQLYDHNPSVEQATREIQKLLPYMSEKDARREALLLCSGVNLVMYPKIYVPSATINHTSLPKELL
jgi:hypothetical protein